MRRFCLVLAWLLPCAAVLLSEPKKPPKPDHALLTDLDLRSVKPGDWIEYDGTLSPAKGKDERWTSRLACVGGDDESLRIETDRNQDCPDGTTWLVEAVRADSSIRRFWWGQSGGAGTAVEAPAARPKRPPRLEGRGVVSKETLEIGGRKVECIKLACDVAETASGGKGKETESYRWTRWLSKELPFPRFVRQGGAEFDRIEWEGEIPESASVVKMVFEYPEGDVVTTVARGWGTDAKGSLEVK